MYEIISEKSLPFKTKKKKAVFIMLLFPHIKTLPADFKICVLEKQL